TSDPTELQIKHIITTASTARTLDSWPKKEKGSNNALNERSAPSSFSVHQSKGTRASILRFRRVSNCRALGGERLENTVHQVHRCSRFLLGDNQGRRDAQHFFRQRSKQMDAILSIAHVTS